MKVYLMRHGQALDEKHDSLQHLTGKGKSDAKKIADFLKRFRIKVEVIITSQKARAIQTAQIIASVLLPAVKVEQITGISPNDSAKVFLENFESNIKNTKDIMLVGHLPFLSNFTSLMLSGDENTVKVLYQTCSVVCLEKKERDGWQLVFAVNPELV